MAGTSRRAALKATLLAGASLPLLPDFSDITDDTFEREEELALAAGMTDEEAVCWRKMADAATAFLNLPEQHTTDNREVVAAIHVIQNKLLSRPTYRKYLDAANNG